MGREPDILVPSDRDIPRAVNEGKPILTRQAAGRGVRVAYRQLAASYLLGEPATRERHSGAAQALRAEGHDGSARASLSRRVRNRPSAPIGVGRPVRRAEEPRPPARDRRSRAAALQRQHRPGDAARARGRRHPPPPDPGERALARRARPDHDRPRRTTSSGTARSSGCSPTTRVSEIMVNGPFDIWIERGGRLFQTTVKFHDESHLRRILNKIVAQVGRRIDESSAMVDARLPDGSRINAIIPPLSLSGPARHDPEVLPQPADLQGHDPARDADDGDDRVPRALRPGTAEHPDLGRYRRRQDDAPERPLGGDPGPRPHRHDRGLGRAQPPSAPHAAARVAPAEHRGRG